MNSNSIIDEIKKGKIRPLYYLYGAESYFLDKINAAIDEYALEPSARDFNREVFYGADTNAAQVINACRSFPVMAQRKLVFLREAQKLNKKEQEKFKSYLEKPVSSTTLVITFKDRNGFAKANHELASKNGLAFHAKKMYDRDVLKWVNEYLTSLEIDFEAGIPDILATNLGVNLNLIENEVEKMILFLKASGRNKLEKDLVFEMINVDKSFNVFELVNAIAKRDQLKAYLITERMTQNLKNYPPVLTISSLFRFFHHLALVQAAQLKDPNSIKHQLNVNYYQAQDYANATKLYPPAITHRNIRFIQMADKKIKGIISTQMKERHVLKTLVWQLMN